MEINLHRRQFLLGGAAAVAFGLHPVSYGKNADLNVEKYKGKEVYITPNDTSSSGLKKILEITDGLNLSIKIHGNGQSFIKIIISIPDDEEIATKILKELSLNTGKEKPIKKIGLRSEIPRSETDTDYKKPLEQSEVLQIGFKGKLSPGNANAQAWEYDIAAQRQGEALIQSLIKQGKITLIRHQSLGTISYKFSNIDGKRISYGQAMEIVNFLKKSGCFEFVNISFL